MYSIVASKLDAAFNHPDFVSKCPFCGSESLITDAASSYFTETCPDKDCGYSRYVDTHLIVEKYEPWVSRWC